MLKQLKQLFQKKESWVAVGCDQITKAKYEGKPYKHMMRF